MKSGRSYEEWALKVIECICNEKDLNPVARLEEIKCVLREDGHYPESYATGDDPEQAWQDEMGSIADSQ